MATAPLKGSTLRRVVAGMAQTVVSCFRLAMSSGGRGAHKDSEVPHLSAVDDIVAGVSTCPPPNFYYAGADVFLNILNPTEAYLNFDCGVPAPQSLKNEVGYTVYLLVSRCSV